MQKLRVSGLSEHSEEILEYISHLVDAIIKNLEIYLFICKKTKHEKCSFSSQRGPVRFQKSIQFKCYVRVLVFSK